MSPKINDQPVMMGRAIKKSMGVGLTPLWLRIIEVLKNIFNLLPYRNPNSEINKLVRSRWRLVYMFNPIVYEKMFMNNEERMWFLNGFQKKFIKSPNNLLLFLFSPWFLISDLLRHKKNIDKYIFKVTLNCYDDSDLSKYVNQRVLFYGKIFILIGIIITWMLLKLLLF